MAVGDVARIVGGVAVFTGGAVVVFASTTFDRESVVALGISLALVGTVMS